MESGYRLHQDQQRVRSLLCRVYYVSTFKGNGTSIGWVIVGGESGPAARPKDEEWVLNIRQQCRKADVSFFFKQWGGVIKKRPVVYSKALRPRITRIERIEEPL